MEQSNYISPGGLADLLYYVPEPIVDALCNYAEARNLSDAQVVEIALASFLDVNAVSLSEISNVPNVGRLREENAILKLQLKATRAALAKLAFLIQARILIFK